MRNSLLSTHIRGRTSVAARIFIQKLNLLFKINSEEDSIGCHIFSKLAAKDPQSLRIIQECRYLEDRVECHGATDNILNSETSLKEVKTSYFDHYTIHHTPIHSPEIIIDSLVEESREMFDYAHHFL